VEVRLVREGGVGAAVDADQLRGHPLADLGLVPRLGEDDQARVRVHVDEARADHAAGGVDDATGLHPREVAAEDGHALVLHADGAVEARVTGAVDDESVTDQEIEHAAPP
jgi:hypothetical protein